MYLVLDIGGTTTRIGFSGNLRALARVVKFKTEKEYACELAAVADAVRRAHAGTVQGVCIGLPGQFDAKREKLVFAPNLKHWIGQPVRRDMERIFRAPVALRNDVALAALGEARFGAGRRKRIVAYVAAGTGIGGCKVVDGRADAAAVGFEAGHQYIDRNRTLEELAGGRYIQRELAPKSIYGYINPPFWSGKSKILARGIANAILFWSPEIVVLGGGLVMRTHGIALPIVRKEARRLLGRFSFSFLPPIVKAKLRDIAGLYGGLVVLNDSKTSSK